MMQNRKDLVSQVIDDITYLVDKYITSDPRKKAFDRFIEKYGERFFSSPASSKEEYHESWPGGLAVHSLRVTKILFKLMDALYNDKWNKEDMGMKETLVTIGLLHDVGKIGDSKNALYEVNKDEWGRGKGFLYNINKKCMAGHHARLSLFILQDCGFQLSEEEFQAILYHDGQNLIENQDVKMKEFDLTVLLHFADRWSVQESVDKRKEN